MLAKAESKPDVRFRADDPALRAEDRFNDETTQGAQAGAPAFLARQPAAEPRLEKPPPPRPTHERPGENQAGDKRTKGARVAPSRTVRHAMPAGHVPEAGAARPRGILRIQAVRTAGAERELETEPAEESPEPVEAFGPIVFEPPAPLAAAAIEANYEGPTFLSSDVVVQVVPSSSGRAPDPLDTTALERARAEFQRIAEVARQNHYELRTFLTEAAEAVVQRHKALQARATAFIGETGPAIDRATGDAQAGVTRGEQQALKIIGLASLHARRLVWGTAGMAKHRIAANADSAGTQVQTIINQLAQSYTDLLTKVSDEITKKGTDAGTAISGFVAKLPSTYSTTPQPIEDVKNEARRSQAPVLTKFAESVPKAAVTVAAQYTDQIEPVRQQFRQSELGKTLDKRKGEIRTKGDKAVDKASGEAIHSLEKSTRAAQRAARQMGGNARKTLESQRKAFRARMAGEGRSLMAMSRGESQGALNGLAGAAKAGLPAFANTVTAIERSLRAAAASGSRPLDAATTGAADDAPGRMAAIARVQREKLQTTNAGTRLAIETREAFSFAGVQSDRDTSIPALQTSSRESTRQIAESTAHQTSSFDSVAKGVTQAAKEWETPLADVFKKAIQDTTDNQKNATGEGSFNDWAGKTNAQKDTFIDGSLKPYLTPETRFQPMLDAAASRAYKRVDDCIPEVIAALNSGIIDVVDETRLGNALRGLTAIQGTAVAAGYGERVGTALDLKLELLNATWDLSDNDLAAARAYLAGNTAEGAAYEMRASIHWYNDEESRIENIMRGLTAEDLAQLHRSKDGSEALDYVRDHLDGTDLKVVDALAAGNHARADAYRMQEAIDAARQKGDNDELHTVLAQYSRASEDRGWTADANQRHVAVQQELAQILAGGSATAGPSTIAPEEAAKRVEEYALAPVQVPVYEGEGESEMVTLNVTGANRDLASALIHQGEGSVDARAARLAVEIQRPDKPDVLKLDTALYDPRLDPNSNTPDDERQKALQERQQVFERFASRYGADNPAQAQMTAQAFAAQQVRSAFGDDDLAADLATRMVEEEHPSPATAAVALHYAARGVGTNVDIVWRFSERLNRDEVQQMRAAYRQNTGNSLDADFGTFGHGGWFTEMSGDDRLRLERALLGQPRNDKERAEVAAFAAQQQRENTGWLGSLLASGSDQDRALSFEEQRLTRLAGATIHVDDDGNPIWQGPDGQPLKGDPERFDKDGRFKGDPDELASAVRLTQAGAQNYAARIDTYANFAATAIAILGAVAATVLTGGAASPLLAAAIAGGAGLVGMGVHWAISGGRYGWEQAVTDLGMTAVQALTAGVGQHLALLSRGATTSFAAGMTTFRGVEGLAQGMGRITGSAVGDMILMGAATSGISSLGQTALSEKTWDKGLGAGFEELFASTLRGMLSGGATAAVSQAFEHIPLGKAGNIGKIMGESENPLLRGGLRGTASALGGFAGRGVEMGLDPSFRGDRGDYFEGMLEGGGQAGLQDFLGGAAEASLHHQEGPHYPGPPREPAEHAGPRPAVPEDVVPERAPSQHEDLPAHPEHAPHVEPTGPTAAAREGIPAIPQIAAPAEHVPIAPEAAPPPAAAPVHAPETPEAVEHPTPAETPPAPAAEHPAQVPTPEESFADFDSLVKELEASPLGDRLEAGADGGVAIETDPTRTRQQAYDAAYRASRAEPPGARLTPNEEIQHWTKVRDVTTKLPAGEAPLQLDIINENRSWLQSRGARGSGEAARTLLTDPLGGPTRYFAGEPKGPQEQRVYGTEHRFVDQYLEPEIRKQIETRRSELGLPPLDPRALAIAVGEQARWVMEGTPGTARSGAVIDLGRAGPQQLLLSPEILSPELHGRGLTVEPAPQPAGGTAAAVGDRFRGDYFATDAEGRFPKGAAGEKPVTGPSVNNALEALIEGPFAGSAHLQEGEGFPFQLRARNQEEVGVRIEIVPKMESEGGAVPVARWDRDAIGAYVIKVSGQALGSEVQRALAHEMAEIRAAHGQRERPDALKPGSSAGTLSPHDEGRLAELEVISRQMAAATDEAGLLRLRNDAEALVDHLGLTGETGAGRERAALARQALPPESPSLLVLESAIATALDNPFLQVTTGNLREDLPLLQRRLELAERMNDPRAQSDIVNDARVLLLGQGAVKRTAGAPLDSTTGSAVSSVARDARRALPPGSRLLDEALRAAAENIVLSPREREAAGRRPLPAAGFEAVATPAELPGVAAPRVGMAVIEQERNRLIEARNDLIAAGAPQSEIDRAGAAVKRQSELAGELAGKTYAQEVLALPDASLVEFGRRGAGLPDLLYDTGAGIVVIECKGGEAELGTRRSVDKTFHVEQGTHEYLRSLATDMARPGNPQKTREMGEAILRELKSENPRIDYYLAQQPFDESGRATTPEISKFDLSKGRVK